MTEIISPLLDAEELLHLALHDIQSARHDAAITKLKEASLRDQNNAQVHFLLAAEHAEIGLPDRALDGMARALELDPQLHVARFQLGLLHLTKGRLAAATEAWLPLDELEGDNAFRLFKSALLLIGNGQHAAAVPVLEAALVAQPEIPALRTDIARLLEDARKSASSQISEPESESSAGHAFLRRYDDTAGNDS